MSAFFNSVLKILAVLCVILFIFATGLSLLLFNANLRLFNPQAYLHALEAQGIYDRLPELVADAVVSGETGYDTPPFLDLLPAKDWETIVRAVIPTDITRSITEQTVVSTFDFLNGKSDQAIVPLTEFKTFLGGPQGLNAVQTMLDNQPPCTPDQLLEMGLSSFFGDEGAFYLCRLPGELGDFAIQDLLGAGLQEAAQAIPDQVVLLDAQNNATLVSRLRLARMVMALSPLLPLGLLLLVTLFAVRSLRDWLGWWGASLFLGGGFGLLIAALVNPIARFAVQRILLQRLPFGVPASALETVRDLLSSILLGLAAPIAIESILILLAGIVLLLLTRLRKPITPAAPPIQPAPPPASS